MLAIWREAQERNKTREGKVFLIKFAQIFFVVGMFWGALACVLMITAWRSVRRRDVTSHRRLMLILLIGGWSFVAFYLIGYSFEQSYSDIVPTHIVPWLAFHGVVALLTLFAITVLVWARLTGPAEARDFFSEDLPGRDSSKIRSYINTHHRVIGRITALFWLLTQAGGFINLYILR